MASIYVALPDPMRDWTQCSIDSGNFGSVSDVIRDREITDRKRAIINALIEGEQSGVNNCTVTDILAEIRKEAHSGRDCIRSNTGGADLVRTARYTTERWGYEQAEAYLLPLEVASKSLPRFPC